MKEVELIGRVGQAAQTKQVGKNTVTEFTFATGGKDQETEWHNVSLWGIRGQKLEQYLQPGKNLYIRGDLKTTIYTSKAGKVGIDNKVKADKLEFTYGDKEPQQQYQNPGQPAQMPAATWPQQQAAPPQQMPPAQAHQQAQPAWNGGAMPPAQNQAPNITVDDIPF